MNILRQIGAFILIIPILIGTIGIGLDIHYCGGEIKDVAFYKDSETCSSDEIKASNCESGSMEDHLDRRKCCSDGSFFYRTTTESFSTGLLIPNANLEFSIPTFERDLYAVKSWEKVNLRETEPPPNEVNTFLTEIQQFLI